MDEQHVRALVREALARHHGAAPRDVVAPGGAVHGPVVIAASGGHVSATQFLISRPAGETDCVIEPAVTCNHCGHCLCLGH